MLDSNHLIGFGILAASPATVAQVGSASSGANQSSYTFNTVALGGAFVGRELVVGVVGFDAGDESITSVEIDSNGMTQRAQTPANETVAGLFQRAQPTGTTGNITVTFSGGVQGCGIVVFALGTLESATPTDTDSALDANPMTDLLNVLANGVAIAISGAQGSSSAAWAGLNETHDEVVESGIVMTAAAKAFDAAQTNLSIGPTFSGGGPTHQAIAMAAWR